MFVRIDNTPRAYAWGSTTEIARLRGLPPSGAPEAELWLGAHPASPARIESGSPASDLGAWIAADPVTALGADLVAADRAAGRRPHLPFLLKVLAAAAPLSLQAHPSPEQAAEGFAREEALGIPVDSPERNYKDPFHKPELIYALSESFDALCGFRGRPAVASDLARLTDVAAAADEPVAAVEAFAKRLAGAPDDRAALTDAVARLLRGDGEVDALVSETARAARLVLAEDDEEVDALDAALLPFETVVALDEAYPGDAGIPLSLLLNRVRLTRGQALFLPAGNIHMYLAGLGVELMAASDNVLRGGFTQKHIDVTELERVLDFSPLPAPLLDPITQDGVEIFRPGVPDFELVHVELRDADARTRSVHLQGPAIAIATAGCLELTGARAAVSLNRGQAVYVTPDERAVAVRGAGELFLATTSGL